MASLHGHPIHDPNDAAWDESQRKREQAMADEARQRQARHLEHREDAPGLNREKYDSFKRGVVRNNEELRSLPSGSALDGDLEKLIGSPEYRRGDKAVTAL